LLANACLDTTKVLGTVISTAFSSMPQKNPSLREARAPVHEIAPVVPHLRSEPVRIFDPVHQNVFPRNENLVEDEDCIILVEPTGERRIKRTPVTPELNS